MHGNATKYIFLFCCMNRITRNAHEAVHRADGKPFLTGPFGFGEVHSWSCISTKA